MNFNQIGFDKFLKINVSNWLLFLFVFLTAKNVFAIDYGYTLFSTETYNDNLNFNSDDPAGYSSNNGITFNLNTDQNTDWIFSTSGTYSKEFFSLDELSDQDTKQLNFDLNFDSPRSNFGLLIRDDFSQSPQNRTATQEISNIVDINTITLRPSYYFKLSSIDNIFVDWSYVSSERKDQSDIVSDGRSFDTVNTTSSIRLERKINQTNDLSLVASTSDTDYEGSINQNTTDFIQDDYFIRWVGRGRYNQLQLEYGISEIEDEIGRNFDTELMNIIYNRQINRNQDLNIVYQEGFFIRLSNNFIDNSLDVSDQTFGSAQEYTSTNLNYTVNGTFFDMGFNLFDFEFKGVGNTVGEQRNGFSISASYSLARIFNTAINTNISINIRQSDSNFVDQNNTIINTEINSTQLRFNYAYSSKISYFISYIDRDTESDNLNIRLNGGDSKSVNIGILYTPQIVSM